MQIRRVEEANVIKLANAQLWVHDQDEALEFWTKKVGMEVRQDVTLAEMGNFRSRSGRSASPMWRSC
jgi:hypothetical protein